MVDDGRNGAAMAGRGRRRVVPARVPLDGVPHTLREVKRQVAGEAGRSDGLVAKATGSDDAEQDQANSISEEAQSGESVLGQVDVDAAGIEAATDRRPVDRHPGDEERAATTGTGPSSPKPLRPYLRHRNRDRHAPRIHELEHRRKVA
jgi:hypothetical protein